MKQKIYLYLPNGVADWELGPLLSLTSLELNKTYDLVTVGSETEIVSKGGIVMKPSVALESIVDEEVDIFVLPGSDAWMLEDHRDVLNKVKSLIGDGTPIAAICGATVALANEGLLDTITHTSNAPMFLEMFAPNYSGTQYYHESVAVRDGNIVTASAAGALKWAYYIGEILEILPKDKLDAWYNYYATGDVSCFMELSQ